MNSKGAFREVSRTILHDFLDAQIASEKEHQRELDRLKYELENPTERTRSVTNILSRIYTIERFRGAVKYIHDRLNGVYRIMVSLRYYGGLSWEKIAERLELKGREVMVFRSLFLIALGQLLGYGEGYPDKSDRYIPVDVKREVRKKCNNKCLNCGAKEDLHFHHKIRYADGGLHSVDNLILLCRQCHSEEHRNEPVYRLLSKMGGEVK